MDISIQNTIYCNDVIENEIAQIISNLNPKKSPGLDEIGPSLVKQFSSDLINPLKYIYSMSLAKGIVPEKLKVAKVIPVFKSGDVKITSNYRPISILSVFF